MNLQRVEGFAYALVKLRDGSVETGFGALEAAKVLFRSHTKFRFVEPKGTKGADYDIDAFPSDGPCVAIEAACKLGSVSISPGKIKEALDRGRRQLPKEGPGMVFLRVPRRWVGHGYMETPFADVATGVLRNSSRLAGIVLFSNAFLDLPDPAHASMIVCRKFWSTREKFAGAKDWSLVRGSVLESWANWVGVAHLIGQVSRTTPFEGRGGFAPW